ncbi:Hypothetical protein RADP37_05499 (plasmid) [Roseomonas mucosa]|uniref:MobA/VirD2-like nuclease domain-containing protein n=1 Tax=Roseomonas mucosa TaxID=207340 RepID=A0A4Y1MPW9_9PROT|nr:Hypothetical protein RADP37_05499 [Roseomonas mucosa]
MIARGTIHSSGPKLAAYLTTGKEGERAELIELRGGLPGETVRDVFGDLQAIADSATRAEKPFFHGYVRLPDDERLDRTAWLKIADRFETALGFQGQPRAVALHHGGPEGNHLHVGWWRINADTMKAIDPGLFIKKMMEEAGKIERDFGLRELDRQPNPDRLTKPAKQKEFEQARRLETDVDAIRNGIRQAWDGSDSGPSFQAAIADQGWILARGDRRAFVVVDERGGDHALGKRICGITAGEVKARLGGEAFRATLPHIDEAKAIQKARQEAREQGRGREEGRGDQDSRQPEAEPGRKRGSKSAGRATVASDDGGMVAQQREAMRSLTRRERLAQLEAQQRAEARRHEPGPDHDGSRHRKRGRSRRPRGAARKPEDERPARKCDAQQLGIRTLSAPGRDRKSQAAPL